MINMDYTLKREGLGVDFFMELQKRVMFQK